MFSLFQEIRSGLTSTLANPAPWLMDALTGGAHTDAGIHVSEHSAMTISAVSCATRVLAESVGFLPAITYERLDRGGKRRAVDHPIYSLLHDEPNPYMSSSVFFETLMGHLVLWGNAYAEIAWNSHGQPAQLWPLLPNRVQPQVLEEKLFYRVTTAEGRQVILQPWEVLHVPGLGFDGIMGYSPVRLARQALGLTLAAEKFGAKFFAQGARASGVLQIPGVMTEKGRKNLQESFDAKYSGADNVGKSILLEEGVTWKQLTIPPDDAQFLETRKFQVAEIARMFRVPLHMLADLERATFSNIEHQSIEFVTFTLGPWLRRWEQELNRKLFSAQGKKRYFIEFLVDGLLRGDLKSRYEAYAIARQNGFMNGDRFAELENQNPFEGGEEYWRPVNMAVIGAPPVAPPSTPAKDPANAVQ